MKLGSLTNQIVLLHLSLIDIILIHLHIHEHVCLCYCFYTGAQKNYKMMCFDGDP